MAFKLTTDIRTPRKGDEKFSAYILYEHILQLKTTTNLCMCKHLCVLVWRSDLTSAVLLYLSSPHTWEQGLSLELAVPAGLDGQTAQGPSADISPASLPLTATMGSQLRFSCLHTGTGPMHCNSSFCDIIKTKHFKGYGPSCSRDSGFI